jgi:hypothetical protein
LPLGLILAISEASNVVIIGLNTVRHPTWPDPAWPERARNSPKTTVAAIRVRLSAVELRATDLGLF